MISFTAIFFLLPPVTNYKAKQIANNKRISFLFTVMFAILTHLHSPMHIYGHMCMYVHLIGAFHSETALERKAKRQNIVF